MRDMLNAKQIAVLVWTAVHTDLSSARLRRKQRSASLERMRLLQFIGSTALEC